MITAAATAIQANSLVNQVDIAGLPKKIVAAIQSAAERTGVDFSYLLKKASVESSLNPNATASSSSATGLYQFTQQTWLQMVKNYGGKYGLGTYADHIAMGSNGVAHVSDPQWRDAILNLRKDPVASAAMAGELDKQNKTALQDNVGGKVGSTELYLAHFLGAGGASTFLNGLHANPATKAARLLPEAAAANPSVFYAKDGTARSLSQIYQHFAQKFDGATPVTAPTIAVASAARATPSVAAPATVKPVTVASLSSSAAGGVLSPVGAYAPTVAANNLNIQGSSLFATMMLSQMHDESAATSSNAKDGHKKTPFEMVGLAGVV